MHTEYWLGNFLDILHIEHRDLDLKLTLRLLTITRGLTLDI